MSRLTRAQIQWIAEVNAYKGRRMEKSHAESLPQAPMPPMSKSSGLHIVATPEELAHLLYPKMQESDKAEKDLEIARAKLVEAEWTARMKRELKGR